MEGRYNTRSPAVKRLMREAQELSEPTDQYHAQPLEDNLFEWHFTVRGPADSDFQQGIYHGRIILPVDYPMKPPSIIWLTPNGRFETNKKICLSISGHHPESWQPSWSIRTALLAIIGFMPTRPGGAIGSLDYTPEERKVLAKKSQDWKCQACGAIHQILQERRPDEQTQPSQEAKDLAAQIQFQAEKPKCKDGECPITSAASLVASSATTAQPSSSTATTPASDQQPPPAPSPSQPPGFNNMFAQWSFPPGATAAGFSPPVAPWPGLPTMPPGLNVGGAPLAAVPRFPLPPSQQPIGAFPMQFFPPGFSPFPQGMGMFPVPPPYPGFPPTPAVTGSSAALASTNNSSAASSPPLSASGEAPVGATQPNSVENVGVSAAHDGHNGAGLEKEPAIPAHQNDAGSTSGTRSSSDESPPLGSAQKREESRPKASGEDDSLKNGAAGTSGAGAGIAGASSHKQGEASMAGASSHKQGGDGTEHSQADLPNEEDENSHSGIPPLDFSETDQRSSYLERSVSSSVPDLEKRSKVAVKGLRHRQSATATVPTTEMEDDAGTDGAEASSQGGQRIEAASGDTHTRLMRPYQPTRAFAEARQAQRNAIARSTQHRDPNASPYDGSFFAMLILSIATALLLLNRLSRMVDWSLFL